jgi:NADH:ubiquinone oxidoreductase subunit K
MLRVFGYLVTISLVYAVVMWVYMSYGVFRLQKNSLEWLVGNVVFTPQCITMIVSSRVFDDVSPNVLCIQCLAMSLSRLEFAYRSVYLDENNISLLSILVWSLLWTCIRFAIKYVANYERSIVNTNDKIHKKDGRTT